jgi:nitric oxide reductase NorD protein
MEWDQYVFYKLYKIYQKIKLKHFPKKNDPVLNLKFKAGYMEKWILLYTGETIEIQFSEGEIFWSENKLYLPESISGFTKDLDNQRLLYFWLVFLSDLRYKYIYKTKNHFYYIYKDLLKSFPAIRKDYSDWTDSLKSLKKEDQKKYSSVIQVFQKFRIQNEKNILEIKNLSVDKLAENNLDNKKESKLSKKITDVEILEEDKAKIEEYTLGHNFEKIETLEEFEGQWRDLDGSDEMEEQEEALSELKLKHLIRTDNPTHSTVSSDSSLGLAPEVSDEKPEFITATYPEWDYKKRAYLLDHCIVWEDVYQSRKLRFTESILTNYKAEFEKLLRRLQTLINEKMIQKKRKSGDDFDLDSLVDRYSDLAAKITPSENVYTQKIKRRNDLFIHFLLDTSLSTDSWVDGKRILDVQKEVLVLFCEALEIIGIPFSLSAFSSRTRNQCKYFILKKHTENWRIGAERLGSIEPSGYTRIGPALRHSTASLLKISSRQKWIIFLTDAKPNDYDRYEGKHGNEDVHKAIQEMKRQKILLHTLAIGQEEKPAIPEMMREASYQLLMHPSKLLQALEKFFYRIL